MSVKFWTKFENEIVSQLDVDDDHDLWRAAVNLIFDEASFLAQHASDSTVITVTLGCCSRWLRPHQTRWTADGGFAWPSGYGGSDHSRMGAPEHDWSLEFHWNPIEKHWQRSKPNISIRQLHLMSITIPARTKLHQQAAIPVSWSGTPVLPEKPFVQFYGFRKESSRWECTASNEAGSEHYELAGSDQQHQSR